jgi:tetratricopeptide (TPR) repeat protein
MQRAREVLEEAQQLWRELGNLPMLADSLCNSSGFYVLTGEYDRALAFSAEALRLSQNIANLWDQSYSYYYIGYVYLDRGELDQAIKVMEDCLRLGEQAGFIAAVMQMHGELAFAYATLGDLRRGYELTNRILARTKDMKVDIHPYALGLLAYLHVLNNNVAEAEALLQPFPSGSPMSEMGLGGLFILLAQSELALQQRNFGQVIEMTEGVRVALRQLGIHQLFPDVLYARGRAFLGQGDLEAASLALEEARQEAENLGSRRMLWKILADLGQVAAQRGQTAEAREFYQQARQVIEYIADHVGDAELRAMFLQRPEVRRVRDEA